MGPPGVSLGVSSLPPVLLTFEDRGPPRLLHGLLGHDAPGWVRHAINLGGSSAPGGPGGGGHKGGYRGWFTKPRALHAWLDARAASLGERLVVQVTHSGPTLSTVA